MEGGGAGGTGAQPHAVVRANFGGFLRYYKTYGKTFSAELAVTCFDVEDRASPSTVHPRIIKPLAGYQEETEEAGRGGGGDGNHIVWLRVHASPPDRPDLDMDVQVRARPLLVTFAPEPLRALARLTAHVEEGSASKGVSEVATRVYSDSYDALASAARIQLDVTIAAPVLLLPARLDDGLSDALALLLELGTLRVTSSSYRAYIGHITRDQPAERERLNRCLSNSRDFKTWHFHVDNVEASMVRAAAFIDANPPANPPVPVTLEAIRGATLQSVINPVALDLALQTCVQPRERVSKRFRVHGTLPNLVVAVSPAFAHHMLTGPWGVTEAGGLGAGLWGTRGGEGLAFDLQHLTHLHVVGIAQAVEGNEGGDGDAMAIRNIRKGFPFAHRHCCAARGFATGCAAAHARWEFELGAGLQVVWILDLVQLNQALHAHAEAVGNF